MNDRTRAKARFFRYALDNNPATVIRSIEHTFFSEYNPSLLEWKEYVNNGREELLLFYPEEEGGETVELVYKTCGLEMSTYCTKEELVRPLLNYIKKQTKRKIREAGHGKKAILGYYAN